ncbi:hypothetical protein CY34DRAFT_249829 [Suillus luteus UH-Slu-Lm8-n1]|uniref:Uncharacterized protein n=1 Tax=Suillus luteus UH-Slu-Lm8-n1 TaxID=930992 RepID=A0A0D0BX34_9AGAM|nr:hypothetical protein CY34DRAFT_249829 [Suillus luteus UH-Slu-Lm8-n1]
MSEASELPAWQRELKPLHGKNILPDSCVYIYCRWPRRKRKSSRAIAIQTLLKSFSNEQ